MTKLISFKIEVKYTHNEQQNDLITYDLKLTTFNKLPNVNLRIIVIVVTCFCQYNYLIGYRVAIFNPTSKLSLIRNYVLLNFDVKTPIRRLLVKRQRLIKPLVYS